MNLKKIELFGFKSFADKTELSFEGGVTAIVGPNGTGKSNVAEAIRWVLGEQSARELRGLKMEDIIFNGTEKRPPLNFSEVSLTFYNREKILPIDYEEVTITRRVFRTGESQYLLNKTAVRLKDISDLLMGTGVGLDSYSIIGQGKIDLILSSKPEDRRYIFEEAAGITRYKSRKKEALRKLEHTQDNLLRINDIIKEVSRQISSIERQVKKANRYKQQFENLKEKEIKASFYSFKSLKNNFTSQSAEIQHLQEKEKNLTEEIHETHASLREAREKFSEIEERLNRLYSRKINIDAQIENTNKYVCLNNDRINELINNRENLERQIQAAQIKIQELKNLISKSTEELSALSRDKSDKTLDIVQKEQSLEEIDSGIRETERNIKESKEKVFEVTNSESRSKNELVKISTDLINVKARLKRLRLDMEQAEEEAKKTEEKFIFSQARKKDKSAASEALKRQKEELIKNILFQTETLGQIKTDLSRLNQSNICTTSRLQHLEALKANFEGYQSGVKSILMAKEQEILPKVEILGTVANLIEVKPGYEKAVETALGANAQIIILKSYSTLKSCIDYLKADNSGDAAFFCLDTPVKKDILYSPPGSNFKPLLDFVKCSPAINAFIEFLLGTAYLAENLDTALEERDRVNEGNLKIITVNGDMVEKNLVTCRTRQIEEGALIGRETKIKALKEEINGYVSQIETLKAAENKKEEELRGLKMSLREIEENLQKEEIELANLSSTIKSVGEELRKINEEKSLLRLEISETEEEENGLIKGKQQLEQRIEDMNKNSFELKSVMDASQKLIEASRKERENLLISAARLKAELSSITDLEISQNQTIKMMRENEKEQLSLLDFQKEEIESSKAKTENLQSEIEELKEKTGVLEKERSSISGELENAAFEKEGHLKKIREIEGFIGNKQEFLEETRNVLNDLKVKTTELNYQMQNIKERVLENYKTDIENADIIIEEDFDYELMKQDITLLKQRVESLGTVNLVAIEENKELEERFDFLNKQRQDLEDARQSLHKAITQINKTTRKLFLETFMQIQQSFREFYKMLFGGGGAELSLLDENDVLESGIEISARPPGKKLQSISLLSGGEKALTAIALLFAVFKVKPSPFCVLDEIDAPLDEANVDRFTKILQDFLKTSQFIVITHNKKTIGMADVMYGVTMEEAGVSKIVSVKFKDSAENTTPDDPEETITTTEAAAEG